MALAKTQMYIFRIELRSFLFGWNALAAKCNRKEALRSIPFCSTDHTEICVICGYALDITKRITIMAVFYATPSMPHDCFPRVVKHAKILRTSHRARAKSTPNTPLIFVQERK